ncbi:hypothetical protein BASA81_007498 [Batrachochytrium salamandrivorans]|nr:hypothetical protein BASA81_007498 [Batrachochytrium salamandrivorans]
MRFIFLILLSFIATNTGAIYTPKVHQIEKRGLPLPAEDNSNEPHLPAENNSNEPPLPAEDNSNEPPLPADVRSNEPPLPAENNSNEPSSSQPNPAGANEQSESSQSTSFTSRMFSHVIGLLTSMRGFYKGEGYSNIIGTANDRWKSPAPNPFLEKEIIERITLLEEAVGKATREEEQKVKDQAKKSQATSDESTTDSSFKNGLDESENDPEWSIETAQEASSSLTEQNLSRVYGELWDLNLLVKQVVKSVTEIEEDDYTSEYRVVQKAAIKGQETI